MKAISERIIPRCTTRCLSSWGAVRGFVTLMVLTPLACAPDNTPTEKPSPGSAYPGWLAPRSDAGAEAPNDGGAPSPDALSSDAASDGASLSSCPDSCEHEGAKQCSGGWISTCERDQAGCMAWSEAVPCPGRQSYCADERSCGNCQNTCQEGETRCQDDQISFCVEDLHGCWHWSQPLPCPGPEARCSDDFSCGSCVPACQLGERRCDDGWQARCLADDRGCAMWSPPEPCPGEDAYCADAETCGSCQHDCEVEGALRCDDAQLWRCAADGHGCRAWAQDEACPGPDAYCADALTCARCAHGCAYEGEVRCQELAQSTCEADTHGCRAWSEPVACEGPEAFCDASGRCARCEHQCELEQERCSDDGADLMRCQADAHGCRVWTRDACGYGCEQSRCLAPTPPRPQVEGGEKVACVLASSGRASCWTSDVDRHFHTTPRLLQDNAKDISAGGDFICLVTEHGTVSCEGANLRGQLGRGTVEEAGRLQPIVGLPSEIAAVACGGEHACALTRLGAVYCWGDNSQQQLGQITASYQSVPVTISQLSRDVVAVTAGHRHSCALRRDGSVLCWGSNTSGQLGIGLDEAWSSEPTAVLGITGRAVGIFSGEAHTCAILESGELACWGLNDHGQTMPGDGQEVLRRAQTLPAFERPIVQGAAGLSHTCAVTDDDRMLCWGGDYVGQLGNGGSNQPRMRPGEVSLLPPGALLPGASRLTSYALVDGTDLYLWGGYDIRLFIGSMTARIQIKRPASVGAGRRSYQGLFSDDERTCAQDRGGMIYCWGQDASRVFETAAVDTFQVQPEPILSSVTPAQRVLIRPEFLCVMSDDGGSFCAQQDAVGLPFASENADELTQLLEAGPVTALRGYHRGLDFSCALFGPGNVRCWGGNADGQLGAGLTAPSASTPQEVITPFEERFVAIAGGDLHMCALTSWRRVFCWGECLAGQCGQRLFVDSLSSPAPVQGLSAPVTQIALGTDHSCALLDDGGVECWGMNNMGQLGGGSTDRPHREPVQVEGLPSAATFIASHAQHTCAALDTGEVACWGDNSAYQIQGDAEFCPTATMIAGLENVARVAVGESHSCALTFDGDVSCWGTNTRGQTGTTSYTSHGASIPVQIEVGVPR